MAFNSEVNYYDDGDDINNLGPSNADYENDDSEYTDDKVPINYGIDVNKISEALLNDGDYLSEHMRHFQPDLKKNSFNKMNKISKIKKFIN